MPSRSTNETREERTRRASRECARRKYARKHDAANRGQRFCQLRQGKNGLCGGQLESNVLPGGRVKTTCPRCERRRRGICQDCPRPVYGAVGRARRCQSCRRKALNSFADKHRRLNPDYLARQTERRLREARERTPRYLRQLAVKAAWRKRNAGRIKLQKRKWRLNPKRPNGYSSREKYLAYHAAYRAKHRERKRQQAKEQYYRENPNRPAPVCSCGCAQSVPWLGSGRPAKWLDGHRPWKVPLTPKEMLMKAAARAVAMLERSADRIREKLKGSDGLREELAGLEKAIEQLKAIAPNGNGASAPKASATEKISTAGGGGGDADAAIRKAKKLYMDGKTAAEIAEAVGVSKATVYGWSSKYGWQKQRDDAVNEASTGPDTAPAGQEGDKTKWRCNKCNGTNVGNWMRKCAMCGKTRE